MSTSSRLKVNKKINIIGLKTSTFNANKKGEEATAANKMYVPLWGSV